MTLGIPAVQVPVDGACRADRRLIRPVMEVGVRTGVRTGAYTGTMTADVALGGEGLEQVGLSPPQRRRLWP